MLDVISAHDTGMMVRTMVDWLPALSLLLLATSVALVCILFMAGILDACLSHYRKSKAEVIVIEDSPRPTEHLLSLDSVRKLKSPKATPAKRAGKKELRQHSRTALCSHQKCRIIAATKPCCT